MHWLTDHIPFHCLDYETKNGGTNVNIRKKKRTMTPSICDGIGIRVTPEYKVLADTAKVM
jgi:hypothetical protein